MTYTTKSGDSFDLISYQQLGSELFTPQLINANPEHITTFIFSEGVELTLPTIQAQASTSKLPWKN